MIPAVWPRLPETRFGLAGRSDAPVFWIDEGQRDQIPTRELEPDRPPEAHVGVLERDARDVTLVQRRQHRTRRAPRPVVVDAGEVTLQIERRSVARHAGAQLLLTDFQFVQALDPATFQERTR